MHAHTTVFISLTKITPDLLTIGSSRSDVKSRAGRKAVCTNEKGLYLQALENDYRVRPAKSRER